MKKKQENKKIIFKEKKIYDYILIVIFTLFLILFTTSKLTNEDDYFWHMATGRYIMQTGEIPSTDVFSFPTAGERWFATEWGWGVLTYNIFNSFGYTGLSVLNTLIYLTLFGILIYMSRKFRVSCSIIILFLTVLSFGIFERLTPRPHSITYLFYVLLICALVNFKYFNRKKKHYLYLLPLMFLIWANIHMGCMIGLVIFGVFIASELIIYLKPAKFSSKELRALSKAELVKITLIFIACGLSMIINPHGITTYMYATYAHASSKMLQEAVMEWLSPFDARFSGKFHVVIYMFFLFSGLAVLYYSVKKKDLFAAVILILFAFNSLRALRFTIDFMLIVFIFYIVSVNFIINNLKTTGVKNFITGKPALKIILSVVLIYFIYSIPDNSLYHKQLKYTRFFGTGIDENYYPVKMFDFINENKIASLGQKPFNTFEIGGFFLWNFPGKQNFFDSRDLNDFIMNEYQVIYSKLQGYEKKMVHYNFDYAIYVVPDIASEPQLLKKNVGSYFSAKTDVWKLVWWNDRSLLFVKDIPVYTDIIKKYSYKYFTPYNLFFNKSVIDKAFDDDKEQVISEFNRKLSEDPKGIFVSIAMRSYGKRLN